MWLRHKGCTTPIVEYVGKWPIYLVPSMKRSDWLDTDGKEFVLAVPTLKCADCGQEVKLHSDYIKSMDGTPTKFGLAAHASTEARQHGELTSWLWFRHVITQE
jgi:hypothetical protein